MTFLGSYRCADLDYGRSSSSRVYAYVWAWQFGTPTFAHVSLSILHLISMYLTTSAALSSPAMGSAGDARLPWPQSRSNVLWPKPGRIGPVLESSKDYDDSIPRSPCQVSAGRPRRRTTDAFPARDVQHVTLHIFTDSASALCSK